MKEQKKRKLALAVTITCLFIWLPSCSVVMATKQPPKKDLTVLRKGTERGRVIAELGTPQFIDTKDGKKVDIFTFVQGYSKGAKVGRAFFHGVADFFTLGLWEVVGTPIEGAASGTQVKVEVRYDGDDRVEQVTAFTGGHKLPDKTADPAPSAPAPAAPGSTAPGSGEVKNIEPPGPKETRE